MPKYILIEIHYDNPKLLNSIVDDSGVKLYFTKQLREQNLGLLILGIQLIISFTRVTILFDL